MNLKEAFRYQNILTGWLDRTKQFLAYDQNVTIKTQEHNRSKVNPGASDEVKDTSKDREFQYPINSLMDFTTHLLELKRGLTEAIYVAKTAASIDIDGAVTINKKRQELSAIFSRMANIKPMERLTTGTDYKFNAALDQTRYNYEIKEVTKIDFDRNKAKQMAKMLNKEADEISGKIDMILLEVKVNYIPFYDANDSFEDVLEQFCTST